MYRGLLISVHHDAPVNRDTPMFNVVDYLDKKYYLIYMSQILLYLGHWHLLVLIKAMAFMGR